MKDVDITVVGYPSIDRIIKTETHPCFCKTSAITNQDNNTPYFGGCSVNVAYLASELNLKVALDMNVGRDFESTGYKSFLQKKNIVLDAVDIVNEDVTSCTYLITNPAGEHMTLFYPGAMDCKYNIRLNEDIIKRSKYGIITVGNPQYNMNFAKLCKIHKVPMVLGMKWDTKSFPLEIVKEIIDGSEIMIMNQSERVEMERALNIKDITEQFKNSVTKIIIVTKGCSGSEIYEYKNNYIKKYFIPIAKPKRVVDTAGVGDAYLAGFMAAYIKGKSVDKCGRLGATLSSFIIEKMGCLTNIPTKEELENRYKENYKEEF
ncbi:carbohydrate kinase family protein [Clostridium rectalis]|uniref:carbohydrate kinase family protein n=1 Tax=Clostridium rectalis TaxID=2040295 RepID=UPI0013DE65FF|nr:PfkB family carbohydrate kinase [Clostridium rectalis]